MVDRINQPLHNTSYSVADLGFIAWGGDSLRGGGYNFKFSNLVNLSKFTNFRSGRHIFGGG